MSEVKPIRPEEVASVKAKSLPPEVVTIFNELIVDRWDGTRAKFKQSEVIDRVTTALGIISRQEVFSRGYLDVECAFEAVGWEVDYDKPGYNETYEAAFTFTKTRRPRPGSGRGEGG